MTKAAAKKKAAAAAGSLPNRSIHLGVRLTSLEHERLSEVAGRYPAVPESTFVRLALFTGIDSIAASGIPLPKVGPA